MWYYHHNHYPKKYGDGYESVSNKDALSMSCLNVPQKWRLHLTKKWVSKLIAFFYALNFYGIWLLCVAATEKVDKKAPSPLPPHYFFQPHTFIIGSCGVGNLRKLHIVKNNYGRCCDLWLLLLSLQVFLLFVLYGMHSTVGYYTRYTRFGKIFLPNIWILKI